MSSNTDQRLSVALDLRVAGYRHGGIARYGLELLEHLRERDDLDITALRAHRDPYAVPTDCRLRTPPHHRWERLAVPIETRLRRVRAAVFHAIDFVAPRVWRMRAVATVHDLAFRHWPDDLAPDALAYYSQLDRSRRWTDAWIVPSQWTAGELSEMYGVPGERIAVVPHGVSLGLLDEPVVPREERGGYVLAVGTVEPRKRYDLLLDAVAAMQADVTLVVVGHPGWRSDDTARRLQETDAVTWLRDTGDAQLRALYREAAVLVMPSRAEGFGLPVLEAMAAGTPVVSSGGGALRELTGDAALTVADASAEAWAVAIQNVLTDRVLWERLSSAGRARASAYTWPAAAAATTRVYLAQAAH